MAEESKSKMTYRYLGNSGLKVSVLAIGTMLTNYYKKDVEAWMECANAAYEAGVNYFDTAEIYGMGDGDKMLGESIKKYGWKRDNLVISVKIFSSSPAPTHNFMSRKHIIEGTKESLKNLGLDYCDLVFSHRPDYQTPLEETVRAFSWLIDHGYAKYWCTSTWPPALISDAIGICEELGLHKPIADQCQYNMLSRDDVERDLMNTFESHKYGTTVWSPLAGGLMSGKYNDGNIPEDSRYGKSEFFKGVFWGSMMGDDIIEQRKKMFSGLLEIAGELSCTQAELALAWVIVNKDVSTCIFGASKISQVDSNVKALEVAEKWTPEIEERINNLLKNEPEMPVHYRTFAPWPARRPTRVNYDFKAGVLEQ